MNALYVRIAGVSTAPALVFLHGGGWSSAMWQPQLEQLSASYYCLAPDLPEQGQSADIGPFTLPDATARVAEVIRERVPAQRAHVVGLSSGGAVATRMLLDVPDVVDHMVISGTACRFPGWIAALTRLNEPFLRWFSPEQQTSLTMRQFHISQQYRPLILEGMRACRPSFVSHFAQELSRIELPQATTSPVLVLVGQHETIFAKQAARTLAHSIVGAKGMMVPGVNHAWNLEKPDLFSAVVRAWISDRTLPSDLVTL